MVSILETANMLAMRPEAVAMIAIAIVKATPYAPRDGRAASASD